MPQRMQRLFAIQAADEILYRAQPLRARVPSQATHRTAPRPFLKCLCRHRFAGDFRLDNPIANRYIYQLTVAEWALAPRTREREDVCPICAEHAGALDRDACEPAR